MTKTTDKTTTRTTKIDACLTAFLRELVAGQSINLAAWAQKVLDRRTITAKEIERLFNLGL